MIQRKCELCGKYFEVKSESIRKKTCSNPCKGALIGSKNKKPTELRERKCLICGKPFLVDYPSDEKKTCSRDCKNLLSSQISAQQFKSEEYRQKHSEATRKAMEKIDLASIIKENRRSYKGENHPTYGKPRSEEWRAKIGEGNAGKRKGMTWEQIYGPEQAAQKREENANYMSKTNSILMTERTSKLEKEIASFLTSRGFVQNCKVGKYTVDFIHHNKKIIIEVYGDYWHCNPIIYKPDYFNKSIGMTSQEKWAYDSARKTYLGNKGYTLIIIWESAIKEKTAEDYLSNLGLL